MYMFRNSTCHWLNFRQSHLLPRLFMYIRCRNVLVISRHWIILSPSSPSMRLVLQAKKSESFSVWCRCSGRRMVAKGLHYRRLIACKDSRQRQTWISTSESYLGKSTKRISEHAHYAYSQKYLKPEERCWLGIPTVKIGVTLHSSLNLLFSKVQITAKVGCNWTGMRILNKACIWVWEVLLVTTARQLIACDGSATCWPVVNHLLASTSI